MLSVDNLRHRGLHPVECLGKLGVIRVGPIERVVQKLLVRVGTFGDSFHDELSEGPCARRCVQSGLRLGCVLGPGDL